MSNIYFKKPWLKEYEPSVKPNIDIKYNNVLEMFQASLRRKPNSPCIGYFEDSLTYQQVDQESSALASAFVELGLKPGGRVGIYLQNVPQWMITQLASWKAGGIAVCLNPMLKERELSYHIKDSGLTILVCLESLYDEVVSKVRNQVDIPVVITTNELLYLSKRIPDMLKGVVSRKFSSCHDYSQLIRVHSGQSLATPVLSLDDTAMLTYTSGTTGVPKGACNTHRNIVFNGLSVTHWVHLGDNDIVMAPAPLFHITGSITGPAAGYASGCPVILFCRFDPSEFLRLIEYWKVTYLVGAITVFIAALSHPDIKKYNLSSVVKMYSGGAPVSAAIQKQVERAFGNKLYVAYGLTESTAPCTAVPHGRDAPVDPNYGALSIGVPTCNVDCRIVSAETGKDVPEGTPGELLIKGPQIVSGYWNKPEETAKAIKNGWLHTGDVAIIDSRGYLYIVDRIKDMIIASGFKVYPREVEDVLYEHQAVKEAAVIGVPDPYRGETVKAFVALKEGTKVSEQELVEFCKKKLAAYKYPRQIEFLPEIPKTLSGKFLRRELRDLELKRHPKAGDNIPNGTIRSRA
ncbi:hypothetical protein GpartN1_g1129.t1 [Galdieria partita]|uniref:Long-chain-fatty-acid--CoA ligase n=1 Tax=Galdieria partita TaxID=83374 RepID=A0A9C7UN30_9RHOD|nr:hypothetical protein GpartN1_g1129.t1 [Galdieria partita]